VLQKLEKDRKTLLQELGLCNHSKDLIHEFDPFFDGPFRYSLNLSVVHQINVG